MLFNGWNIDKRSTILALRIEYVVKNIRRNFNLCNFIGMGYNKIANNIIHAACFALIFVDTTHHVCDRLRSKPCKTKSTLPRIRMISHILLNHTMVEMPIRHGTIAMTSQIRTSNII